MASSGWIVTGLANDQYGPNQGGQPVLGTYVYFLTSDGNAGSVFVAEEHLTTAAARKIIEVKANLFDSVRRLAERYTAPA